MSAAQAYRRDPGHKDRLGGLAAVVVIVVAACIGPGGPAAPRSPADPASCPPVSDLPGLQTGPPPWSPALDTLEARLVAIGAPILRQEGQAIDHHVTVNVFVDGQPVLVPDGIGINGREIPGGIMVTGFVTEIHIHDRSGLVHIHALAERSFTLGELFDIWGVALSAERLGGECASGERTVRVFVDNTQASGDPRAVELRDGSTILVAIGTSGQLPPALPEA